MKILISFLVGGAICAIVQLFIDKTKLMPGRIMVILVCFGSLFGFLGFYDRFVEWAGAGASVPLLGFGNTLYKGVEEAIKSDGILGLFRGGLKASALGISAALVFGYLASLIFDPKMKE